MRCRPRACAPGAQEDSASPARVSVCAQHACVQCERMRTMQQAAGCSTRSAEVKVSRGHGQNMAMSPAYSRAKGRNMGWGRVVHVHMLGNALGAGAAGAAGAD
jgi:hypothetical protein